jgi:hypothetical protein
MMKEKLNELNKINESVCLGDAGGLADAALNM